MADACSVAGYRKLAWTAGWPPREATRRRVLATVVDAQQRQPLAALFGPATCPARTASMSSPRDAARRFGLAQHPARARATDGVPHPPLVEARSPRQGRPAVGRGRLRHLWTAVPRGRSDHLGPSHGRRRGERPRLRPGASARLKLRPAHPQPRLYAGFTPSGRPRVGRRWPRSSQGGSKASSSPRTGTTWLAPGRLGAHGRGRRVPHPQTPRSLPAAERVSPGAPRTEGPREAARSGASSARFTPWTGWSGPRSGDRRRRS